MEGEVKLSRIATVLESLDYPTTNAGAQDQVADVTVRYADGNEPLADVIARSNDETFEDEADLEAEIFSNVPVEAVGEPGQSEGEG